MIVVDDGSRDDSAAVAERLGARVLRMVGRSGPAAARNRGAREARGEIVVFIDADCEANPETFRRLRAVFQSDPSPDAAFGSYDDAPVAPTLVSQFKNLLHHYTHQTANRSASTFWAGCGAIRRAVFLEAGGFDEVKFDRPSIEDIDLGVRLVRAGRQIVLDPAITVRHHKRWTLRSMIRTDVFDRAIPWTRLMHESGNIPIDLNLRLHNRLSAVLIVAGIVALLISVRVGTHWTFPAAAIAFGVATVLNLDLYRFFARKRGVSFLLAAVPLHFLYYVYSVAGYVAGIVVHRFSSGTRRSTSIPPGSARKR